MSSFTHADYLGGVARVREYIRAGDVFQANLSQRFDAPLVEPPWTLYCRLARAMPPRSPPSSISRMPPCRALPLNVFCASAWSASSRQAQTRSTCCGRHFRAVRSPARPRSAMETIAELEPSQRSVYCRSIADWSVTGALDSNIAIRTAVAKGDRIYFSAGGGILADSDPEQEYRETLDKARGLIDAIQRPQ